MARQKRHDDEKLKQLFTEFWDEECLHDPRRLSYTGLARFMKERDVDYDDNALKHRAAIVDMMRQLKSGGSLPAPREAKVEKESDGYADKYEAQLEVNKKILELYRKTFLDTMCARLLIESGLIEEQDLGLTDDALEKGIIRGEDPINSGYVRSLVECLGLVDPTEQEENSRCRKRKEEHYEE